MERKLNKLFKFNLEGKCIGDKASVAEAIVQMAKSRVHCLVVKAEGGKAVGILSEHDIVSALANLDERAKKTPVRDVMTIDIHAAYEEDTLDDALKIMADQNIRHLPVLSEQGAVLDFLSIMDIIIKKSVTG